jgi:5-(carboxyamino)imidazole ribonucleotide mutase
MKKSTRPARKSLPTSPSKNGASNVAEVPLVGVIMGSRSDWETMRHASETLDRLGVVHEVRVVSAHRTPDLLMSYAGTAQRRGLKVIIAGAGGAAHLPGMAAAKTSLPVLGVPVESAALKGMDSLLSIVQMPAGIPVGTLAIGRAGAINAALFAAAILALEDRRLAGALADWRSAQSHKSAADGDPRTPVTTAATAVTAASAEHHHVAERSRNPGRRTTGGNAGRGRA